MITQWDIISNLNQADSSIQYSLLIDGTEQDAHLIAKKLTGYVKAPHRASAPFAFRFALPADLDEDTLEKLRVAVREAVEQSKKISEFAPVGSVGSPLFQNEAPQQEGEEVQDENKFPTFITLDPSDTFSKTKKTLPSVPPPAFEEEKTAQTPAAEPESEPIQIQAQSVQAEELPQQMIAENTPKQDPEMLAKAAANESAQPLDDILLAATKYDMFVDVDKELGANAPKSQAQATDAASDAAAAEAFNIFEQKIKDQTAFIDLSDISAITERISQKDLNFIKHTTVPAQPAATPAQSAKPAFSSLNTEQESAEEVLDPFEQLLASAASKPDTPTPSAAASQTIPPAVPATPVPPAAEQEPVQTIPPATPTLSVSPAPEQDPVQTTAPIAPVQHTVPIQPQPAPITEKNMTLEHPEEPKTFTHLRRKQTPSAPQTPPPPVPPAVPQQPAPATPHPVAPHPAAPTTPHPATPAAPHPAAPQMPTANRHKPSPVNTFIEKTHTIDHSIEIPLSELQQNDWPLEVPLIPTYTLENMTISINRFAHATAVSVIENPGKMYNPLVLHGGSGTGKTHFLHAIGYALSKKYEQENIFVTNGVRLSRGIQRYISEGKMDKFEEFTSKMKALLIDDIHLISINEQNRAHLAKLLSDFRSQNKQIVITSKYPPENLAKLEELLNFKLDSGWISELKQASGPARMRIIQQMLADNGVTIPVEDSNRFFGHPHISLGLVARSIRRVRVLEKLIFPETKKVDQPSTLAMFDQLLATKGEDQNSLISQKSPNEIHSVQITGKGEWGRIGFFYPQSHSNLMNWMLFALQQRAKELGISGGLELAVRSSYTTDNIISSAFKIANLCDNKKLKGAIILGPSADTCEPSVRDNFYDILTHMLEIMLIRCGVLNLEDVCAPSTYVKILSELLR